MIDEICTNDRSIHLGKFHLRLRLKLKNLVPYDFIGVEFAAYKGKKVVLSNNVELLGGMTVTSEPVSIKKTWLVVGSLTNSLELPTDCCKLANLSSITWKTTLTCFITKTGMIIALTIFKIL